MIRQHVSFDVPGPPQPKQRARRGKGGRWYTPAPTRRYEKAVRDVAELLMGASWRKDGVFRLTVHAVAGTHRRFDCDNVLKAVSDALNGVGYEDDNQVTETRASKAVEAGQERTSIVLERIGDGRVAKKARQS